MSACEVIITSDVSGRMWNCSVWDPRTGTNLMNYKGGGTAAPHTVNLIGADYLIAAETTKPLLHAWPLDNQERVQNIKLACPGRVNALAVSRDTNHLVAAVDEKIYVWQVASGRLLAVLGRHFQTIVRIKFSDDCSHFVSCGEDGVVLVWALADVIAVEGDSSEPKHAFCDHSLPVRDLFVGAGGPRSRFASVSDDRTCRIYDLATGAALVSAVFDVALTAIAANAVETDFFVGARDGKIYVFGTSGAPRTREFRSGDGARIFSGHDKPITCLSVSTDGVRLLSGSEDGDVVVWHVPSGQKIRTVRHGGTVTNAFFSATHAGAFETGSKPTVVLHDLERIARDGSNEHVVEVNRKERWHSEDIEAELENVCCSASNGQQSFVKHSEEEFNRLKQINAKLYDIAVSMSIEKAKTDRPFENRNGGAAESTSFRKKRKMKKRKWSNKSSDV